MKTLKSISSVVPRIRKIARRSGEQVTYSALLMIHAFRRKETPCMARHIIFGSLGYLLTPFDALPDFTPVLGYTDDLGVLSFGLVGIACYINDQVRENARKNLKKIFGSYNPENLVIIDQKL